MPKDVKSKVTAPKTVLDKVRYSYIYLAFPFLYCKIEKAKKKPRLIFCDNIFLSGYCSDKTIENTGWM